MSKLVYIVLILLCSFGFSKECPKTLKDLEALKETLVKDYLLLTPKVGEKAFDEESSKRRSNLEIDLKHFDKCMSETKLNRSIANKCTKSIRSLKIYLDQEVGFSEDELKMKSTDGEHYKLPEEFKTSSFYHAVNNYNTDPKKLEDIVKELKTKYKSLDVIVNKPPFFCQVEGFNEEFPDSKTIIMRFEEDRFDRFFHFFTGLSDNDKNAGHFLNMTMEKLSKDGQKLSKPNMYFQDGGVHKKEFEDSNSEYVFEQSSNGESCFICHSQGIAGIVVKDEKDLKVLSNANNKKFTDVKDYVKEFNLHGYKYGNPALNGDANLGAKGTPEVGPMNLISRDDYFYKTCAPKLTGKRLDVVKSNMNCASCHNGTQIGKLQFPFGGSDTDFGFDMVDTSILYNHMPPGVSLDQEQKEGLIACLRMEYLGGLDIDNQKDKRKGLLYDYFFQDKCEEIEHDCIDCGSQKKIEIKKPREEVSKFATDTNNIVAKSLPEGFSITVDESDKPEYQKNLNTGVCGQGYCKPIDLTLRFDHKGRFLGVKSVEKLSKSFHQEFSDTDYKRLVEVVNSDKSSIDEVKYEDLTYKEEAVDGISGATKKVYQNDVVGGAAYTTSLIRKEFLKLNKQVLQN